MTSDQFKALFPEFSSSIYDARIAALLTVLPLLDEDRAGNQLTLALGCWIADKLTMQDLVIKYGVAGASASSSTSTEKRVGDVSIKTAIAQSQSNGVRPGRTSYLERYDDLIRQFGTGAVAV